MCFRHTIFPVYVFLLLQKTESHFSIPHYKVVYTSHDNLFKGWVVRIGVCAVYIHCLCGYRLTNCLLAILSILFLIRTERGVLCIVFIFRIRALSILFIFKRGKRLLFIRLIYRIERGFLYILFVFGIERTRIYSLQI